MKLNLCLPVAAALFLGAAFPAAALDVARAEAGVDAAVSRFGVTGKGVLVAILDRGVDWQNEDFRNGDGSTRIKWIFDLTDDTGAGAAGNIYGQGTLYSEARINAALAGGGALATRDAVGHGTTTTSIAAGNGRGLASRKYRGVAPEAGLIIVKIIGGAPAHGTEPAEASFYQPAKVLTGLDFVRDKARELGMPCVMLPNYGSIEGPADGTSPLTRKIDSIVAPGLLFVNGPGDDGGMPNRASGTVPQDGTASLDIQKGGTGLLRLHLWHAGADRFEVTVAAPGGTFGPYPAPAHDKSATAGQPGVFTLTHTGAALTGATNGKRRMVLDFSGAPGIYSVQLKGAVTAAGGRFEAGLNPSTIFQAPAAANRFLTFAHPGSLGNIWDGATAALNICPGDYVIRTHWTDIDGVARSLISQGTVGQIWKGSSAGPAWDGRLGVDFCAPGDSLFTAYGPKTFWATARNNLIQDGAGKYGRANAVSAAAPFAAGVVALMLQMNPKLDAAAARAILQTSARADAFTGAVPNPQWGFGKIDALAALSRTAGTLLRITEAKMTGGAAHISFTSVPGMTYRVEFSDALDSGPGWAALPGAAEIPGTGAVLEAVDPAAAAAPLSGRRFYRVAALSRD